MKKRTLIILSCFFALMVGCNSKTLTLEETLGTGLSYAEELQETLDHSRQLTDVVGVSAAIIVDEEGMWSGNSGESYPDHPVTDNTLFDLGSAGKMLVGPLMVKLAEDGLISFTDPISKYLPDFPYADGTITIQQLLNHTSGLYMMTETPDGPFRIPFAQIDHEKWWTIDEIFTILGGEPYFTPGEGYCYTQAGYQIATLVIEEVTGSTVAEEIQARLLDPLNIDGMVLDITQPVPGNLEIAHPWFDVDGDGNYDDIQNYSRNWIASLSRIYFHSRAKDFAIWGHALLTGEIFTQDSMNLLLDFYRTDDWCGDDAFLVGYGMGVQDFNPTISHGHPAWGHLGSIQGSRAYLAHLYEDGITIAVMINTDSDQAMPIVDNLLEVVYNHTTEVSREMVTLDMKPVLQPPEDVLVVDTFQKETLFCTHNSHFEIAASPEDWINVSLDWVIGTNSGIAEEVWKYHDHTITIDGQEIKNPENFTHDVEHYSVICPDETFEIWAKGLSIYLPPLPKGEHEIVWISNVTAEFNNGWVDYKPGNFMEIKATLTVR